MPTTYAIPDGRVAMAATLYTGTGAAQNIYNTVNGVSFQPDLVWMKARSVTENHQLFDSVRGVQKSLYSNLTNAETTDPGVYTFNTNGFNSYNASGQTYVGWQWKAGGTPASNTAGSITSSVSANPTAGFSVVTYTANGAAAQTIGHGLGVAPSMVITKCRAAGSSNWGVYHQSIGNTGGVFLNTTNATVTTSLFWNNTSPTSTVFSVGTNNTDTNFSTNTMVAYCFAPVAGYSAFGKYTGNGSSDGSFIYLGFKPRFVMVKRYDGGTNSWVLWDSSRDTYNIVGNELLPNSSIAESTLQNDLDFLSNGFKLRNTYTGTNASGATYIYACFAENPFKYSNAR